MITNENEVRQLFVIESAPTTTPTAAKAALVKSGDNSAWISYFGNDLLRSDIIQKGNVISAKSTAAAKMEQKLKSVLVTVKSTYTEFVAGDDYILRIAIRQAFGTSDEDTYIKYGVVRATSKTMAKSDFYLAMAKSLVYNFKRENTDWFKFYLKTSDSKVEVNNLTDWSTLTGTYTGIVINEIEQPFRLGCIDVTPTYFDVILPEDKEGVEWGSAVENSATAEDAIPNSKKTASLEYFLMGERADIYRQVGFPYTIDTTYFVNASETSGYNYVDIVYYWAGDTQDVQKSRKAITLVAPNTTTGKTAINKIIGDLNTALGTSIATFS